MIIPELPSYLSSMGGENYKGFIISLFTLTAGLSRPFSGKLADTIGRRPVIFMGMVVCIICSLLYPILTSVGAFMLLRLVHGFSTGFSPTGMTAYISDIVPIHRRGEAMGIIGVSINLGSSISPPIGSYLAYTYSLDVMFLASSLSAVVSILLVIKISESLKKRRSFEWNILRLNRNEIISKSTILPALVCGFSYFGFGVIITITPDQCEHLGMLNKGLFFSSFTICSVLSRVFAGKASDLYGRIPVMRIAIVLLAISYAIMGMADSPRTLLIGSGLVGFTHGIVIPGVFAWTVDLSKEEERGRGLATLFIGLEVAIGMGALIGAALYANDASNYSRALIVTSMVALVGLVFVRQPKGEV